MRVPSVWTEGRVSQYMGAVTDVGAFDLAESSVGGTGGWYGQASPVPMLVNSSGRDTFDPDCECSIVVCLPRRPRFNRTLGRNFLV